MKYLVIGAGGVGGVVAGFLKKANHDVTLICRGETLDNIKENGLIINSEEYGVLTIPMKACRFSDYHENPDVVFVAVKGYSLEEIIEPLGKIVAKSTIVIPLLNIYGTGEYLAKRLSCEVLSGCIYIMADIISKGVIMHRVCPIRIVFGYLDGHISPALKAIEADIKEAGMIPMLSTDIRKDTFLKYALISTMAGVGYYYDATVGDVLESPLKTAFFLGLSHEIEKLGIKLGITFDFSIPKRNLDMMQGITKNGTTSLQKDLKAGHDSEIEGILFKPYYLLQEYGSSAKFYQEVYNKANSK